MDGQYVAEKIKFYKRQKRVRMIKALVAAGFTCSEIAFAMNLKESDVRASAYGTEDVIDTAE